MFVSGRSGGSWLPFLSISNHRNESLIRSREGSRSAAGMCCDRVDVKGAGP